MKMGVFQEWNITLPKFPLAAALLTTKGFFLFSSRIHRVLLVGQCYKLKVDVLEPEKLVDIASDMYLLSLLKTAHFVTVLSLKI